MCLKERFPAWKVDLKHGALEVNVHVADDYWVVGLPFLRQAVVGSGHIVNPGEKGLAHAKVTDNTIMLFGFCLYFRTASYVC